MYAFAQKSGHNVWKEQWSTFTSRVSLQANLYMTPKNQVFVTNVVVTDPTRKMAVSNVIN
jgi:hypothetical protein